MAIGWGPAFASSPIHHNGHTAPTKSLSSPNETSVASEHGGRSGDASSASLIHEIYPGPPHVSELVVAPRETRLVVQRARFRQHPGHYSVDQVRCRGGIGVCAADRLRDNFVD